MFCTRSVERFRSLFGLTPAVTTQRQRSGPQVQKVWDSMDQSNHIRPVAHRPSFSTAFGCLNMPGCAAVGCNNRSEKGYIMKCFPRDPKLRKIWQDRVARADWEPSNNSFLCHVHFEPQEWSITQSGRIRLKKNAVPSIFTVTSTRKSPKKRTKIFDKKNESTLQEGYMDNDTEHSSIEHLEEKGLRFHEIMERSVQSVDGDFKGSQKSRKADQEENMEAACRKSSIGMIGEDNLPVINHLMTRYNLEDQPKDIAKEAAQISSGTVKEVIKLEAMDHNTFADSYDEIEQKLKQICDSGSSEDESYKKEIKKAIKSEKEGDEKEKLDASREFADDRKAVLSGANHGFPTKNEVGNMLADKKENVEIIFGVESGDEKAPVPQSAPKVTKTESGVLEYVEILGAKSEKKVFNEDIEENFTKDEVHVIPNIRAAMKRKRRTREEIMKSIKKSIRSTSDQDVNSTSSSDLSEQEEDTRNQLSLFTKELNNINKSNKEAETAKFVIKVTGDPEDVTEIIEELSSNTIGTQISKKFSSVSKNEENASFVTSIITVLSPKNSKEIIYSDFSSPLIKDEYVNSSKKALIATHSPCEEREFARLTLSHNSKTRRPSKHVCSDEEETSNMRIHSPLQNCAHVIQTPVENSAGCTPSDYEDLLERIQIQEDVIAKLTDQLIIYKELENNLKNKSSGRELQSRDIEISRVNTRSSNIQTSVVNKKNLESKQRLIEDLSNRVNYFEEMNKKLMKTVTLESQQKRKLEGQIKQKDNRIKELNWKLEKASKYLERAEKNTNTYRRKMLNMQTIMRRRKLLDEKMSKFNEMLIDSSKQEFSEKVLVMAADIRKICGRSGYDKLLSYGFPLPPLPALRKGILNEDFTDTNKSDLDDIRNSAKVAVKTEKAEDTNNESEADEKDLEFPDSINKGAEYEGAETVTGTVQDIFDENNDGDDFSTNELREHFILQLNAVM